MTALLEWRSDGKHWYSEDGYTLILLDDGYLVDYEDLSLGHGMSFERAQEVAQNHSHKNRWEGGVK